jgi:hypothetical protein
MATSQWFVLLSSAFSSSTSPGVMTRTTSRGTMPLHLAGSIICSQMATDSPCLSAFAT